MTLAKILPILPHTIDHDIYTIVFLVMALMLVIIWHDFLLVFIHKVREMVLTSDVRTFEAENANSGPRLRLFLAILNLASFSIFSFQLLNQFGITNVFYWQILVVFILLHTSRIFITRFLAYIFSMQSMFPIWIETYSWVHYMLGVLVFPLAVIITYSSTVTFSFCANLAGAFFILGELLFFYRMFFVFYRRIVSLFYLFLYLCTLEIIPLLIVFRFLS